MKKSQEEANVALMGAYLAYKQLAKEGVQFELAKAQNQDRLPLHMWRDWRNWKKRLREVDRRLEKYYR